MRIKAPKFWSSKNSLISWALLPFSCFYSLFIRKPHIGVEVAAKVISIGNLTIGGAGKTPLAMKIADILISATHHFPEKQMPRIAFISRGYGRKSKQAVKVTSHDPKEFSDEPLLLAKIAPTYLAKNRLDAAKMAIEQGAELLILDDAYQNFAIKKDVNILVIDGEYGFGNGRLFPAGPLREYPKKALKRADIVVMIGGNPQIQMLRSLSNCPFFYANITSNKILDKPRYLAFAGIARPEKFFMQLKKMGANIVEEIAFPDHHFYNKQEIEDIIKKALELQAVPITTEKDMTKINRDDIEILPIELVFEEEERFLQIILNYTNLAPQGAKQ